jgi:hypothetical protein
MNRYLTVAATILLSGLVHSAAAMDLPAEVRLDRKLVKGFAKDAPGATVTFRLFTDSACASSAVGSSSTALSNLDHVQRVKNEALKGDPTPVPKEEWVLGSVVPVPDLEELDLAPPIYATVSIDNGGTPVVSTCQRQKLPSRPSACGDGLVRLGEDCDGTDLQGETCQSLASTYGTLGCSSECSFDVSQCGTCPGGDGTHVAGACWYIAAENESCASACTARGLPYSQLTRTYAGSDGTLAQCYAVLDAFGYTSPPVFNVGDVNAFPPAGCMISADLGARMRFIPNSFATDADATVDDRRRVCACTVD